MSATWKVIFGWVIVLLVVLILLFSWPTPLLSSALSAQTPTPLPSRPSCPDQAAALLPKVEPLIEEFKEERDSAFSTSRISLGPMIARMRDVFKKTNVLEEWPEPVCGYALREKLRAAEEYDIETIVEFQERRPIRHRPEQWQDAKSAVGVVKGYRRSDEALKSRIVLSGG